MPGPHISAAEMPTADNGVRGWFRDVTQSFLGGGFGADPEQLRLAGLITGFGFWGALFGLAYAVFYVAIGHLWGAGIIFFSSALFGLTPLLLRQTGSVRLGGHLLSLVLVLCFSALCTVEGGLYGHAIAWLASVPLCALLLVGKEGGWWWCGVSFLAVAVIAAVSLSGRSFPFTYAAAWHARISAIGYGGLIAFMFGLGLIFETGRVRAFRAMQDALARLETSNSRLVHLNKEKNEFLSIAAHDLNNPLTTIITGAELLRSGHPELLDAVAGNIYQSGTRMRDLVRDLLDVNAIEEGRYSTNFAPHDLAEIARVAMDQNSPAALNKGSTLQFEGPVAVAVLVDRAASVQVLENLISNALKYSPPKSEIRVWVRREDGFGVFGVRDQGPGISEADRSRMFRKFTRLSARPTAGESSNGLGLCIVKRLVETMSGTVECLSEPGSGAEFVVRFPQAG